VESISILLPVFRPNISWLKEQLESIAEQTFKSFRCVVSHDGPIANAISDQIYSVLPDNRFKLVLNSIHLGTYRHVDYLISEFGLQSMFFALCDQDDVWLPKKLETQLSKFAYWDVSAVSNNGSIVNDHLESIRGTATFDWFGISHEFQTFGSIRNQLTGASALFRSDRFLHAVPFPEKIGSPVHDHWLYLAAVATGGVWFDAESLWLYRQHEHNQIGATANRRLLSRLARGIQKMIEIVKNRYILKNDPVINQGRLFLNEARERWASDAFDSDVLCRELNRKERLNLLRPKVLIGSSFESLRVAISQQK
jgi:glycosyltransferase involved in cell wall biosynthesis